MADKQTVKTCKKRIDRKDKIFLAINVVKNKQADSLRHATKLFDVLATTLYDRISGKRIYNKMSKQYL
ncbi:hypothetical protein C7999DRAFT_18026 [Corynascus novoguineensis]|uniref:Uncharacterized protein n=1 Tax=Corynascus novoguineensis TaxID=1126955 RepID=A0AAN7HIV4_9PEZI|nr:hypothetical protein C7999DRAFT_18026 [Corynascus novoguineensis]